MYILNVFCIAATFNPDANPRICPHALKMVASLLVYEITTFLREVYQNMSVVSSFLEIIILLNKIFILYVFDGFYRQKYFVNNSMPGNHLICVEVIIIVQIIIAMEH